MGEQMFYRNDKFNQSLDPWDVSQVGSMILMFYSAESFNQCLSTWAKKTITVKTQKMFIRTLCPCLQNTDEDGRFCDGDKGPWCQTADICPGSVSPSASPTAAPTVAPSNSPVDCEDDTKIKFLVGPDKK